MTIPLYEELGKSPADIAIRLCELNSDEYIIAPFEPIYTSDDDDVGFRMEIGHIMRFICAETDFEEYDGEESDTESLNYSLSMMHDAVRDWLFKNISEVIAFAAVTNTISVELLQGGSYKITACSQISAPGVDQYISKDLPVAEIKKRKMLLAAIAALRHERSAEIAYLKNDMASFAVHFSYMWRSYARLATYPALHDGRALEAARPRGSGRPKEDRKPLRKLLKKFHPDYLNEEVSYRQVWEAVRSGLGTDGSTTHFCGSLFYFQLEATSDDLTAGTIVEKRPRRKEQPLVFKSFCHVISSLRKAQLS